MNHSEENPNQSVSDKELFMSCLEASWREAQAVSRTKALAERVMIAGFRPMLIAAATESEAFLGSEWANVIDASLVYLMTSFTSFGELTENQQGLGEWLIWMMREGYLSTPEQIKDRLNQYINSSTNT